MKGHEPKKMKKNTLLIWALSDCSLLYHFYICYFMIINFINLGHFDLLQRKKLSRFFAQLAKVYSTKFLKITQPRKFIPTKYFSNSYTIKSCQIVEHFKVFVFAIRPARYTLQESSTWYRNYIL